MLLAVIVGIVGVFFSVCVLCDVVGVLMLVCHLSLKCEIAFVVLRVH